MVIYILAIPKRSLSTLDLPGSMEEPATCVLMTQTPKAKKNDKSIEELVPLAWFQTASSEALIQKDKAYAQRGVDAAAGTKGKARYACPHRDRPVAESLAEFRAMQGGKYRAQPAVLRMKQDLANGNPQMWDITAYRVVEDDEGGFCKHLRTGDKWKIYPSYDFTHCLCDSLKTSPILFAQWSLSYLESLTNGCAMRLKYTNRCSESMAPLYGRLNMNGTVLSKRKLITLISGKLIQFHSRTLSISTAVISGKPLQNFYRLSLGVSVSFMKVPFPITATSYESDPTTGLVTVVRAKYEIPEEGSPRKKPKSYIHWVAHSPAHGSPIKAEVHVFHPLFNSTNPLSHPDGYLADINPNSEEIFPNSLIDIGFNEVKKRAPWPADTCHEGK
ncbi:glutaminyl-tRNA synthetase [Blastomyces dermatitidis ER-3]|uniref:glutamine--tRNA ligase n=1 Tax=Ajellomyces dermatitidis (strain ER-3 / ATCC MYA-2586) TaxID=559297 RepID=A0ABP2EZW2_AJEDR|nr:glutaminyl-tRNA synthetase [Blastomyces dermatitidis ER-3]EEQ89874.2 glutaminyl-tRNA synthetase [Blastomyces dermatitidis ER-3]EQL37870.1 hypothetical protein BDFG_00903 [Blastomyces dermatitidis ATCC 26199]